MRVGEQVRKLRKERNLSQRELAEIVGVHQAHIANIENGNKTPSFELAIALAESLGVTLDELACSPRQWMRR